MFRRILLLPCALILAAASACGSPSTDAGNTTAVAVVNTAPPVATTPPLPTLPNDDAGEPLVARVNGEPITLETFRRMAARFQAEPSLLADPNGLRAVVMRTLIQDALIKQEAAREQIAVSDAEIDAELARYVESAGGQDQWNNWLALNMYTAEEFRASLRDTLLMNRMRDHVTDGLDQPVLQVHARHILVETREQASQLLVQLREGQDFAALAVAFSMDTTTKPTGGDLGWFTQEELLEAELARIAFELQPGQIAGPVETALGYHIIQTLEAEVRPIADEKRVIMAQTQFEQWLASLEATASIEQYL